MGSHFLAQPMGFKSFWSLIKTSIKEWSDDKVPRLGASLAYYTLISLSPLLIMVIAIAGLVFGREAASGEIVNQISGLVGQDAAKAVQSIIKNASEPSSGIIATVVGFVTLMVGATGVFVELQDSLNTIWRVTPKPDIGFWGTIRNRLTSFAMVFGIGFLLLTSLVISAGISAMSSYLNAMLMMPDFVLEAINLAISFGFITVLFMMTYKVLPDVKITWHDTWIGAAITAFLFTIGKYLIGLYLGHSTVGSSYGAAGSLVVLLVWVYYSTQILFFGAEFTKVYANSYGTKIQPDEMAMLLSPDKLIRQGIVSDSTKKNIHEMERSR